ncbi:MAG TPA: NAD(P)H-dependent oxidoreductase [Candidatus Paceibacterota bacterium]|nr:NAD(P)H-dependent oxidoreductase [Candidatus Paceibacterota bacterium]
MGFFSDHSKKKIVILIGHPDSGATLSREIADIYKDAAKANGHKVKVFKLGDMDFDPILHKGYKKIQKLEPDLIKLQEAINWCDHFVVIYPNWWSTMPALLKGLFDRMWLPGFAFNYYKGGLLGHFNLWKRRMYGKTARVFVLSATQPFFIWMLFGDYTNEIKMGILWFSGFKTSVSRFGPSEKAPEWLKNSWFRKVQKLGKLAE